MKTLTAIRKSTSMKLRAVDIPEAFALATVATATRKARNPRDDRRALNKALRVAAVLATLALEACGGQVGESIQDPFTRYAENACSCADPGPCNVTEIVTALRNGTPDVACVDAYSEAMETRSVCTDHPAMPTCEIFPGAAAERYARAVCACGDGFAGCHDNVVGEVRGGDPRCLNQLAAGYESDCSGRSGKDCTP